MGNDLANIIFQNTSLFQGLVFSDTATPDYLEKLKDYLAKDQKRGILKDGIDLEVAAYLYSTIEFNAYQYCIAHDLDFSKDTEILRKMTDMFFFGIYRDDAEAKIKKRIIVYIKRTKRDCDYSSFATASQSPLFFIFHS